MVDPGSVLAPLVAQAIAQEFGQQDDLDVQLHRSAPLTEKERANELKKPAAARRKELDADLQCDVGPRLARRLGIAPQVFGARLVEALPPNDVVERAVAENNGFVNFVVRDTWLAAAANRAFAGDRLGVPLAETPDRVVIDYSAPNVAKEMHVGHMRSTIIGDSLARVLEWRGHTVIRQNHLGDWGTPIGMLYEHDRDRDRSQPLTMAQIGAIYRAANARFESDPEFAARARRRVKTLQDGADADTRAWWQTFIDLSLDYIDGIYAALGVTLTRADIRGESFFNDRLAPLVAELEASGAAVTSDGAVCLFPSGFLNREGGPMPIMLRKSDGGYGYGITDLAAIRYRLTDLGGTRLIYVVGAAQAQHLSMIHRAAAELGWLVPPARVTHVPFGLVLGSDKKKLASREGKTVRLADLISDAIALADKRILELEAEGRARAAELGKPASEPLPADQRAAVARVVGVGSIKFADLSCDRKKDYVFDLDRMVAFRGDTAGYLQYAHARVRGIFRELEGDRTLGPIEISDPAERTLVLRLLEFGSIVRAVESTLEPHRLAGYLYDLALAFTAFYGACPVLTAAAPVRASRLALVDLTGRTLARGLDLLGIAAPDRM